MLDAKEMFYRYLLIYFPFVLNGVASQLANRALAEGVVQYKHFHVSQNLFLFLLVFNRFPHTLNLFLKHDLLIKLLQRKTFNRFFSTAFGIIRRNLHKIKLFQENGYLD